MHRQYNLMEEEPMEVEKDPKILIDPPETQLANINSHQSFIMDDDEEDELDDEEIDDDFEYKIIIFFIVSFF